MKYRHLRMMQDILADQDAMYDGHKLTSKEVLERKELREAVTLAAYIAEMTEFKDFIAAAIKEQPLDGDNHWTFTFRGKTLMINNSQAVMLGIVDLLEDAID